MTGEKNTEEKVELTPAEDSPWGKFFLKTIELDGAYGVPRGSHWYTAFYMLKDRTTALKIELAAISDIIPDNHAHKNKIVSSQSYLMIPIEDLIKNLGNPETIKKIDFSNLFFDNEQFVFSNFIFPIDVSFARTKFSNYVGFDSAIFGKEADFIYAEFLETANFHNSIFSAALSHSSSEFSHAIFSSTAAFHKTTFHGSATFKETTFSHLALFNGAKFSFYTLFNNAKFFEHTDFSDTTFSSLVELSDAVFSDNVFFTNAKFILGVGFNKVVFSAHVDFVNVRFNRTGDFINTTFSSFAQFNRATLESANFSSAKFEKVVPHFYDTKISADIIWELNSDYWPPLENHTEEEVEKNYTQLVKKNQNAYENLAYHMEGLDKYHDQHFFFRQETRCRQRLEKNPFIRIPSVAYEWLADYGYGFGYALFWWSLHIILGAIVIGVETKNALCALPVSFANAHSFLFFNDGPLTGCYEALREMTSFKVIWGIQTIVGIILLFLVLLTLRIRFRLK